MKDHEVDRLLRSAAQATPDKVPAEMPFGFDTRVVAVWRAATKPNGVTSLLRRVALVSAGVIVISTLAALREARQSRQQFTDLTTNGFAIADTAIHDQFSQ
jgi:hypothetical protein